MDLNRVTLLGRICGDPELKTSTSGKSYVRFSVATSRRWKDENEQWKSVTDFHPMVGWGWIAEKIVEQCKKGDTVFVEGTLRHRSWEDAEGKKKNATEVVVDVAIPLIAKNRNSVEDRKQSLPSVNELTIEEVKSL